MASPTLGQLINPKDAETIKKLREKINVMTGSEVAKTDKIRIQVEGDKDSGKSSFVLSVLSHLHDVMGLSPKEICMVVIDFDKGGMVRLLKRGVIPENLKERITYIKVADINEGYDAWSVADSILSRHVETTGKSEGAWIVVENTGQMWQSAQDYYSLAVEGIPVRELMLRRKREAKSKGKATLPTFGNPRDSYGVINPLHNDLRNSITNSDYNVVFTCHLKDVYGTKETGNDGQVIGQRGEGQKKNEADMDFVIRCHLIHKTDTHIKELRASKDTDAMFKKETDMNFTAFWKWIYTQMEKESKEKGYLSPDNFWLTPQKPVKQKKEKSPDPPKAEPIDDDLFG